MGSEDELAEVVAEIEGMGRRAVAVRADISDGAQVEAAVAEAADALGTITVLANVAGGSGPGFGIGPLVGLPEAEFRKVLDVNLTGTWLVSKAVASRMVAAGVGGSICSVSSQAGKRAFPMLGAYCAAKAGVILMTQVMATELGPSGITVNAVCPGTVDTNLINPDGMLEAMLDAGPGSQKWIAENIPLNRLQTADDVAAALCFLLSPDGSYITGEALNTSGGQTMV
jgi:NAD(P)-dependent dehydrogenase (short-subunit alcohol dehydrogenase family)